MTHPLRRAGAHARPRPPLRGEPPVSETTCTQAGVQMPTRPGHSAPASVPTWEELLGRR